LARRTAVSVSDGWLTSICSFKHFHTNLFPALDIGK
jgi:hypothetical protein